MSDDDLPGVPLDEEAVGSIADRLEDHVDELMGCDIRFDAGSEGRLWASIRGGDLPGDVGEARTELADHLEAALDDDEDVDYELYARPLDDRIEFCAELRRTRSVE
ncbi:MAG: hypothetical protein ABEL76_10875 [Bradymonadaceae bacterium]